MVATHAASAKRRQDFDRQSTTRLVRDFHYIVVGNVNAAAGAKSSMASNTGRRLVDPSTQIPYTRPLKFIAISIILMVSHGAGFLPSTALLTEENQMAKHSNGSTSSSKGILRGTGTSALTAWQVEAYLTARDAIRRIRRTSQLFSETHTATLRMQLRQHAAQQEIA